MKQVRTVLTLVAAAAAVLIWVASTYAATEKRVAFVVGNGSYEKEHILPNTVNDADDISAAIRSLGFEVTKSIDVTGDGFAEAVDRFSKSLEDADVALFYYSGHAIQLGGVNYLLPVDFHGTNEITVKRQSIDLSDILEQMESQDRISLIFLDACRNNPFTGKIATKQKASLSRGLASQEGGSNTMIVYATTPGNTASDGAGRNSPFTEAILENIKTPGLEIEIMMKRVTRSVSEKTDKEQSPERLSKLTADFYFKPAEPELPVAAPMTDLTAALADWNLVKDGGKKNLIEAFLNKYSHSPILTDLAKGKLAELERTETASLSSDVSTPVKPEISTQTDDVKVDDADPVEPIPVAASEVQKELKRLGCYSSAVDGKWGRGSNASLASFNKYGKADLDGGNLDRSLLDALKSRQGTVCPSSCAIGMTLRNGDCEKIVCASESELKNGVCTPKPRPKQKTQPVASVEKPSDCFMMDDQKMCE